MSFAPTPTPIKCPFCQAHVTVPLRQIVDVSEEPALKEALLTGVLNAFRCPSCGNSAALASPFLYHDPDKELAFIFMPMGGGSMDADQQRMIGSLSNAVMSKLPPEKRKAYLLQPKQFFSLQNLIEAILGADGITPDMIAAQQAKMQLLQTLADTPPDRLPEFIKAHDSELDEEFFAMFGSALLSARSSRAGKDYEQLIALRTHLYTHSTVGAQIQVQQQALDAFTGNPTRETLLEQLIQAPNAQTRQVLVSFGRSLLDYAFFQALTARIEAAKTAGDQETSDRLLALRREVQDIREQLDAATRALFESRAALVREMLSSQDMDKLAQEHLEELDDAFFNVLETNAGLAQQREQPATLDRLQAVADAAMRAIQSTQPPEVQFIQVLLSLNYPEKTGQFLEENRQMLSPELVNWMRHVAKNMRDHEQTEAADKLDKVIQQAVSMTGPAIAVARR